MDLTKLLFFKTTAELENMTKAAEVLDTSQPFLSKTIQEMENELGVQLFDRPGRGIVLNIYGKKYYQYAKAVFENIEDGARAMKDMKELMANTVRVGTNACIFLPTFYKYARNKNGKLTIMQETDTLQQLLANLNDGKFDCLFLVSPNEFDCDEGIKKERLLRDSMHILLHPDDKLAKQKQLDFDDIAELPIVAAPEGRGFTDVLRYQYSQHGISPSVFIETTDSAVLPKYVANNLGITAFPQSVLSDVNRVYGTVDIPYSDEDFAANLYLVYNGNRYQNSIAEDVYDMAIDYYENYYC